jgi:hypothetical protein
MPAARARCSICWASWGVVAKRRASGIPACRPRAQSLAYSWGRESSRSSKVWPSRPASPRTTPIWQVSIRPAVPRSWRATPAAWQPCVQKAGLVEDQHAVRVTQMLAPLGAQLLAHGLRVPRRAAQPVLKAIGRGVSTHCRHLPAVLALSRAEHAPQGRPRPLPGLGPLERGRQPALEVGQGGLWSRRRASLSFATARVIPTSTTEVSS